MASNQGNDPLDAAWEQANGKKSVGPSGSTDPLDAAFDAPDTSMSMRNMLRSFMQGATLNLGDSKHLPESMRLDPTKEAAFKKEHGVADFLLKMGGGAVAPIVATLAAPEALAGLGGAALLGAGTGAIAGAAEGNDRSAMDRLESGGQGGALGMAAGAAGYGLSKVASPAVSAVLDRMHPERAVARAASKLIEPADVARLTDINARAPGTASIATATLPQAAKGQPVNSRFLSMVRGLSKNPEAAAQAEQSLIGQTTAIKRTTDALGAHMNLYNSDVPVTPKLRATMGKVRDALGGKTPELPDADFRLVHAATPDTHISTAQSPNPSLRDGIKNFWDRQTAAYLRNPGNETTAQSGARSMLERHDALGVVSPSLRGSPTVIPGKPAVTEPETVDLQVLRDALGRLRYMARNAARRGTEANGPTTYEIKAARNALQDAIYQHEPNFADLDTQYGTMMDQQRQVDKMLKTVRLARQNGAANDALKMTPTSVGGSLHGPMGVTRMLVDKMLTDKAGAADAVNRFIVKPGDPSLLPQLLKFAKPASPRIQATANGVTAGAVPSLRDLLLGGQ